MEIKTVCYTYKGMSANGNVACLFLCLIIPGLSAAQMIYDIFINCNWVVARWQYTFTPKQYIEQHK
jgi:hypothetical protein